MSLITAKKNDTEVSIEYDFGASLQEAAENFGEDVVFSGFISKSVITAQAAIRRYIEAGKSAEEIQTAMADWKPGVALKGEADPVGAVVRKVSAMDDEAKANFIAALKERLEDA